MPSTTRRTAFTLASVAAALAISGCSFGKAVVPPRVEAPPDVVIKFRVLKGDLVCPYEVVVREGLRCERPVGVDPSECLFIDHVRNARERVAIRFQPELDRGIREAVDLDFRLQFNPFGRGEHAFRGGRGDVLELGLPPVPERVPAGKTRATPGSEPSTIVKIYSYNVLSEGCPVLDPQVVIREPGW